MQPNGGGSAHHSQHYTQLQSSEPEFLPLSISATDNLSEHQTSISNHPSSAKVKLQQASWFGKLLHSIHNKRQYQQLQNSDSEQLIPSHGSYLQAGLHIIEESGRTAKEVDGSHWHASSTPEPAVASDTVPTTRNAATVVAPTSRPEKNLQSAAPHQSSVGAESTTANGYVATWSDKAKQSVGQLRNVTPDLFAIALVYFVQGITDLATLAQEYFLKDELHCSPAQTAAFLSAANIPWVTKPFIGFISDSIPLLGYKRRSYLILASIAGSLAWFLLCISAHSVSMAVFMIMITSTASAVSDVIVDSVVVEKARGESQATSGSLQSLCWAAYGVGEIASAYLGGSLVQSHGPRFVFAMTALFPLVVGCCSFLLNEQKVVRPSGQQSCKQRSLEILASFKTHFLELWHAFARREIWAPLAFLFLLSATPGYDAAMFYYQTNYLGFTATFLGEVNLVVAVASLAGVLMYNYWFKTFPLRPFMLWGTLIGALLQSTQLLLVTRVNKAMGLNDHIFVLGGTLVMDVVQNILFMPTMVLAARLCPEGVEATMFASIMSLGNFANGVRSASGAVLMTMLGVTATNFTNMPLLVLICTLCLLLPLPLLYWIPSQYDSEPDPQPISRQSIDDGDGDDDDITRLIAAGSHDHTNGPTDHCSKGTNGNVSHKQGNDEREREAGERQGLLQGHGQSDMHHRHHHHDVEMAPI